MRPLPAIKPGGRWHRVLVALAAVRGGLTMAELRQTVRNPDRPWKVDKGRTFAAVEALGAAGLVCRAAGRVSLRGRGAVALAAVQAANVSADVG